MNSNKFDYLIPELSKKITEKFLDLLSERPEFNTYDIDTAPLLNMSMGVLISSMCQILDAIKKNTDGEKKLINNIELCEKGLLKFFADLPFVSAVKTYE